ncbi:hypothetical protein CAAN1_01S00474 [[Candida] anglica]|uniref:Sfi1 spindle body domain-containing protein n=1 Tax=[Candida] anglica TaxID=148631 RepID=A0ABP0EJE7_9ASCO
MRQEHGGLEALLNETLRELSRLHSFTGSPDEYERIFYKSIHYVEQLLGFHSKKYKHLNLKSSPPIGDLSLLYYVTGGASDDMRQVTNTPNSLFQLLKSYTVSHNHPRETIQRHLQSLLADDTIYAPVLSKLSALIDFFIRLHRESERRLVEYINTCFQHEQKFYSSLKSRIDSDLEIGDEDTQQIVKSLDNIVARNVEGYKTVEVVDTVELLSSSEVANNSPICVSSDQLFTQLYQLFLQLCMFKSHEQGPAQISDHTEYIHIMIELYKKQVGTEVLEIDDFHIKDLKFNYFYNQFLLESRLIPTKYYELSVKLAREIHIFPEQDVGNCGDIKITETETEPPISESYDTLTDVQPLLQLSRSDQSKLVNSLKLVIPQMVDYFSFDLEYPQTMRHFLNILYQPKNDDMQFEYEDNCAYVAKILRLVNIFIDYENGDISEDFNIHDAMDQFYQLHLYLVKNGYQEVKFESTLLMRLAVTEYLSISRINSHYFSRWNYKTVAISQLDLMEYNLVNVVNPRNLKKKILQIWFSRYMKYSRLGDVSTNYYELRKMDNIFKQKWLLRTNQHQVMATKAALIEAKKGFEVWKDKFVKTSKMNEEGRVFFNTHIMEDAYAAIKNGYEKRKILNTTCDEFSKASEQRCAHYTMKLTFRHWYDKMNGKLYQASESVPRILLPVPELTIKDEKPTLSQKLRVLNNLEKRFITSKYIKQWERNTSLAKRVREVKYRNDQTLVKFVFAHQWRKKYELNELAVKRLNSVNNLVLLNAYQNWKEQHSMNQQAVNFRTSKDVNNFFKVWKLKLREKNHLLNNSKYITPIYINIWKSAVNLKQFHMKQSENLAVQYFSNWDNKRRDLQGTQDRADNFRSKRLISSTLLTWANLYNQEQELNMIADLNVQRKYYNSMIAKKSQKLWNEKKAEQFSKKSKMTFRNRIILKSIITKWHDNYSERFDIANEEIVEHFQKKVSRRFFLSRAFETWAGRYNEVQEREYEMNLVCNQFLRRSTICTNFFTKWSALAVQKTELLQRSLEFDSRVLFKKHLVLWYDKFNRQEYLSEMAETHLSQHDLITAQDLLHRWSMKYIKNIRRNQQSCEMFLDRWQTARARTMFEVWLYKSKRKRNNVDINNDDDEDEEGAGNISMISNQSPLANKSAGGRSRGDESYLNTPLKRRERLPYTPSIATRTSPTKLQETTERLKSDRLNAMIKHYQRVKGSNSPRRLPPPSFSPRKQSAAQITQPKRRSYGIEPPKRPNFTHRLSQNIEMSDDESSGSIFTKSSPVYDEEDTSTIETAKSLRRITPIFIPSEEDMAPRFSPVSKLKERIGQISRHGSPTFDSIAMSTPTKTVN